LDRTKLGLVPGTKNNDFYFLAFPFALAPSRFKVKIESNGAFLSPESDFLPGVVVSPLQTQHALYLRDKTVSLTIASRQTPSVEFGEFGGFKTRFAPSEPTFISRLLMNTTESDTKDQGIVSVPEIEPGADRYLRYEYSLRSGASDFDPVATSHFGWEFSMPLQATVIQKQPGRLVQASQSFLSVDKPNVLLLDVKRAEFGDKSDYILRLQEIAGVSHTKVTVESAFPIKRAELDNMVEERIQDLPANPLEIPVGKHETVTVRLGF